MRCLLVCVQKWAMGHFFQRWLLGRGQLTMQSKHWKFSSLWNWSKPGRSLWVFFFWWPFLPGKERLKLMQVSVVWPRLCEVLVSHPAAGVCQGNRCYQQLESLPFSCLSYSLKYMFICNCLKMLSLTSLPYMYSACFLTVQYIYKTRTESKTFEMCSKDHKVLLGTVIQGKIEEKNCIHGGR